MIIDFLLDDIRKAIAEIEGEVSGLTAESFASVDYVSSAKTIYFYNAADEEVGSIDTTDFVVDGMIDTVSLSGNVLHFVFNTDAGKQPIDVDLSTVIPDIDRLAPVAELPASAETGTVMALYQEGSAEWAYWDEPVVDYADSSITYTYHQNVNSNKGGNVGTVGFYSLADVPIITVSSRNVGFGGNVVELTFTSGGTSTTQNMFNGINGPRDYFSGNCEFNFFTTWSRLFESTCVVENGDCILTIKIYLEFIIQQAGGNPKINDAIDQPRTIGTNSVYQYDGSDWVPVGVDDLSAYWTSAQTKDYVDTAISGIDLSNYYTKVETDSAITLVEDHIYDVEKVTASALTELHDDILELSGATPSTEEIELPIAAAVNELKGNFETRLDQQYYKKAEVNDIAARKVEAGQVDVQIKDYVDPAIAEVNDTIEDKELPVSAALNKLNEDIATIDEVIPAAIVDINDRMVSSSTVKTIWRGSQNEYDAITVKDAATLYIII